MEVIEISPAALTDALEPLERAVARRFPQDEALQTLFHRCLTDTLQKAPRRLPNGHTYVITGDIPAMWLRDSAAQMRPYLLAARGSAALGELLAGLSRRHFFYLGLDPYANAFNAEPTGGIWQTDETVMTPWVWERKYELDSLCYPLQFAYLLWKNTGRTDHLDAAFWAGAAKVLDVMETEQFHEERSAYRFQRRDCPPSDTLAREGLGARVRGGCGLIWSAFRPSDDACTYGYLIPANMFAVAVLEQLAALARAAGGGEKLAVRAQALGAQVRAAIEALAVTEHPQYGRVYAYETDGFGHFLLQDDANVPNLLAMEYLGYRPADPVAAANTRRMVLSRANPLYFEGTAARGLGSAHTQPGYIWHLALAMQGLTATDDAEKQALLAALVRTAAEGRMHEAFDADAPECFTRPWFSWADALFCEFVLQMCGLEVQQ